MLKPTLNLIVVLFLAVILTSFDGDLQYKNVLGNNIKVLIPDNFIHVSKNQYKLHYQGDQAPDDLYCNKDSTESIAFINTPAPPGNFDWCREMMKQAFLSRAIKTYFNDTTTINGNKVYVAKFKGSDYGKMKYMTLFFINVKGIVVMGGITCDAKLEHEWTPISEKILNSIKVN